MAEQRQGVIGERGDARGGGTYSRQTLKDEVIKKGERSCKVLMRLLDE